MTQIGRIIEQYENGTAQVSVRRGSMCEGCHKAEDGCTVCAAFGKRTQEVIALNTVCAKKGDLVRLEASSARVIFYAFCVFLFPLILATACYLVFDRLLDTRASYSLLAAFGGLVLSYVPVFVFVNRNAARHPDVKIVGLIHNEGDSEDE